MTSSRRYLVDLLHSISHRQAFFLVWLSIVGGFVLLMYLHYRKRTRSNFKKGHPDGAALHLVKLTDDSPAGADSVKVPKQLTKGG